MSAPITIDSFTLNPGSGTPTAIEVLLNNVTGEISVNQTGTSLLAYDSGTPTDRSYNGGNTVYQRCFGLDLYTFTASYNSPFVDTAINANSATCGYTGGGGSGGGGTPPPDDLVIQNIGILQEESAPAAANGQVQLFISGSNSPFQYSLDGSTYQSTAIFIGLTTGNYIAYVRDGLGTVVSQAFFMPQIVPTLIGIPVNGQSRWSALFNPIVFDYQSLVHAPGRKFITEITANGNTFSATHSANLTGYCRADISKYLRVLLQLIDTLDYSTINYPDANLGASYTVRYREVWSTGASDWTSITTPFYVTYAALQIGNKTGSNMSPHVTLPTAGQTHPAKFLNDFAVPRFYTDMPFDLSFIYSELLVGYNIQLGGNGIDVNGNITAALAPVALSPGTGVNRLRITPTIPPGSVYADVFLFYADGSGNNVHITETKRLLLDSSPCNGLPYEYLKWMGPSGGWLYYLLIKNQVHELNVSNPVISQRFISNYASADSTQQLISIDAQRKITAGKNDVNAAEADVLATLLYSPKVYRLVDAATNTWQGVIVDTKSLTLYQTYEGRGDFEISYLLPEINTQRA